MRNMPILETRRLWIRPLSMRDLNEIHRLFDLELSQAQFGSEGAKTLQERSAWLCWTLLNYEHLARLNQPPYGERAIVLKEGERLIGAVGFVPCLNDFGRIPYFSSPGYQQNPLCSTEFGLFYAISPRFQGQGFASEAAGRMIAYAFDELRLHRVVATTTYENAASIGVMHKLGMHIERNPYPDPPWLQIVGILPNPALNKIPAILAQERTT